jgi:hypothetical protein
MRYTSAAASTLFVKVNFKRTPYANTIISLRIIANSYEQFTANTAAFLVDLNPDTVTLAQVEAVAESLRIKANFAEIVVKIPQPVRNKLEKRG